jgi:hypothetical protein
MAMAHGILAFPNALRYRGRVLHKLMTLAFAQGSWVLHTA